MSETQRHGNLLISVDVEPHNNDLEAARKGMSAAEQILGLLNQHSLHATWALTDPATSGLRSRLTAGKQEIALLGDPSWVGRSAGRTRFARELARRMMAARSAQLPVTTLALRNVVLQDGLDLVVRNGITALRGETAGLSRDVERRPAGDPCRLLHFGVWEFPTAVILPAGGGPIWRGSWSWRLRRSIDNTIRNQGVLHVLIETFRIGANPAGFIAGLDRALRHAAQRCQHGSLVNETLTQAAGRLSHIQRAAPVRSILRAA